MPALNFMKAFADKIESGEKRCTIRKRGKRAAPAVESQLKLYTGMRSKACRLLRTVTVDSVLPIKIIPAEFEVFIKFGNTFFPVQQDALTVLAADDGFKTLTDFFKFFAAQVDENGVFEGYIINWALCDE